MEISKPYSNGKMARIAAVHSKSCETAGKFLLLYDQEKGYIHFVAGDKNPDASLGVIGRYELRFGRWRDVTPLAVVTSEGGYTVKST